MYHRTTDLVRTSAFVRTTVLAALLLSPLAACARHGGHRAAAGDSGRAAASSRGAVATPSPAPPPAAPTPHGALGGPRTPNELGRIPILEYHLITDKEARWEVEREHFRRSLQMLYDRGYRPVTIAQLLDRRIDLPAGFSPVVFTFDDASPSQFSYVERDGKLEIDPNSAVGIWLDFHAKHPDWGNRAVFCTLSGAAAGHNLFGDKSIDGQKTEWRFRKVKFLADQGFELCNHTLWHAQLSKYPDAFVQEQIVRGQMAIDSAVPGYRVRTFALPQGLWPKNKALAWRGSWTDPKSKRTISYNYDAVLEVAGGPSPSPYSPKFDPHHLRRYIVYGNELEKLLDQLDRAKDPTLARFVAGGRGSAARR